MSGPGKVADHLLETVCRGHATHQMARAHVNEDAASSDADYREPAFESGRIIHTRASMPDCRQAHR